MSNFCLPERNSTIDSELYDKKMAAKTFSRIGLAIFSFQFVSTILQFLSAFIASRYWPQSLEQAWFTWGIAFIPIYCFGFPVFLNVIKSVPRTVLAKNPINKTTLFQLILISGAMMHFGSLIGSSLISSLQTLLGMNFTNPIADMINSSTLIFNLIATVIIAPFFEEFVFRKTLIDRTIKYGEKASILFSAFTFALFHTNIFQFFYAFGIGLILALVYIRTGKLKYPIIIHATINLIYGNLIPMSVDSDIFSIVVILILAIVVSGIILFFKRIKTLNLADGEILIPNTKFFSTIFLNLGMILLITLSTIISLGNLFL